MAFLQKTHVRADLSERDCVLPSKGIHEDQKGHFVIDSISQAHTTVDEPEEEEEWDGNYQPLATEETHEFGLCGTIDRTQYSDRYPFTIFGDYEADEEDFIPDVPHQTTKSNSDQGSGRKVEKVLLLC